MLLKYKRKNIFISPSLVRKIFKNNFGNIVKLSNRVFFVDNKVIKFSDPRFSPSHLWSEICGYKTASVLGFKTPKIFSVGHTNYKGRRLMWFISEKIKGDVLKANRKNVSLVFELIRRLHRCNSDRFGSITKKDNSFAERNSYLEYILDVVKYVCKKEDNSYFYKKFVEKAKKLIKFKRYVFTHGDIKFEHILVDGNFVYLLDFELCQFLDKYYDYTVFTSSLIEYKENLFWYGLSLLESIGNTEIIRLYIARDLFFLSVFRKKELDKVGILKDVKELVKYFL